MANEKGLPALRRGCHRPAGPDAAIREVAGKFGVRYEKSTTPTAGGYTMAHTVSIFGLDAAGRPGRIIGYDAGVEQVLDDVRALLAAS